MIDLEYEQDHFFDKREYTITVNGNCLFGLKSSVSISSFGMDVNFDGPWSKVNFIGSPYFSSVSRACFFTHILRV